MLWERRKIIPGKDVSEEYYLQMENNDIIDLDGQIVYETSHILKEKL